MPITSSPGNHPTPDPVLQPTRIRDLQMTKTRPEWDADSPQVGRNLDDSPIRSEGSKVFPTRRLHQKVF